MITNKKNLLLRGLHTTASNETPVHKHKFEKTRARGEGDLLTNFETSIWEEPLGMLPRDEDAGGSHSGNLHLNQGPSIPRPRTSTGLWPRGWGSLLYTFEEAKTDPAVGMQGSSEEIKRVFTCHSYASSKLYFSLQDLTPYRKVYNFTLLMWPPFTKMKAPCGQRFSAAFILKLTSLEHYLTPNICTFVYIQMYHWVKTINTKKLAIYKYNYIYQIHFCKLHIIRDYSRNNQGYLSKYL